MTHNGIDIDQFLLLAVYPSAIIFGFGFLAKKKKVSESIKYTLQAITCIIFSIAYFVAVPNGGAQGLAIVLALFGVLLFFMARKYVIQPEDGPEGRTTANKET
ncbi:MAG: hypothetical protein WCF06_00800 [Nitrososphaeraceae archaeon]